MHSPTGVAVNCTLLPLCASEPAHGTVVPIVLILVVMPTVKFLASSGMLQMGKVHSQGESPSQEITSGRSSIVWASTIKKLWLCQVGVPITPHGSDVCSTTAEDWKVLLRCAALKHSCAQQSRFPLSEHP